MNQELVQLPPVTADDAQAKLSRWLRKSLRDRPLTARQESRFQFRVPAFISDEVTEAWLARHPDHQRGQPADFRRDEHSNTAPYFAAAWEFVRRGILVPTRRTISIGDYLFTGEDFCLTPYGERWAMEATDDPLPSEHGRFAAFLDRHSGRFRPSYRTRSQEALRCYEATTYIACCAMCGAAAESVLLSLAIEKRQDEKTILDEYRKANGRTRIRDIVVGRASKDQQQRVDSFIDLLKYWRDEAAHAGTVPLDEEHAFTSLLLLLRFARFADENWTALTT